jgi:hypothetical protein
LVVGRFIITDARCAAAQTAGYFLKTPRYPSFAVQWIILLFVGAIILAHLYARVRQTLGPGTALRVGFWVGLIAGLPYNLARRLPGSPATAAFPSAGCSTGGSAASSPCWSRDLSIRNHAG